MRCLKTWINALAGLIAAAVPAFANAQTQTEWHAKPARHLFGSIHGFVGVISFGP